MGISSIAGIRGNRFSPAYGATKAFQMNYMEALRARTAHLKLPIYITDIRPGFRHSYGTRRQDFWVATVEKAGKQIFNAIQKKRKVVYVSKRWRIFAYVLKILPRWIHHKI